MVWLSKRFIDISLCLHSVGFTIFPLWALKRGKVSRIWTFWWQMQVFQSNLSKTTKIRTTHCNFSSYYSSCLKNMTSQLKMVRIMMIIIMRSLHLDHASWTVYFLWKRTMNKYGRTGELKTSYLDSYWGYFYHTMRWGIRGTPEAIFFS